MKKIISILLTVITIVALFCGCENVPALENPVPNTPVETTEATEATEPVTIPEVEITEPTTPPATEPMSKLKMGEQVWIVYNGEGGVSIKTGIVVAEDGNCVIVTTIDIGTSGELGVLAEALKNSSSDAMEYVEFFPVDDCYKSPAEAWEACGREPME